MNTIKANQELDCRGMTCPLPILKTKKAVDTMKKGEVLKVQSTDPGSSTDMISWANRTGNEILETEQSEGVYTFYVEVK